LFTGWSVRVRVVIMDMSLTVISWYNTLYTLYISVLVGFRYKFKGDQIIKTLTFTLLLNPNSYDPNLDIELLYSSILRHMWYAFVGTWYKRKPLMNALIISIII